MTGTDGFRIEGVFNDGSREETISCKWKLGKKEVFTNGTEYEKLTDHIGKYSSVMIAPDDMELINDGSELRRKWVDSILGQVDKEYLEQLMRYQRILLQRNAWLKMQATRPTADRVELEYYNKEMGLAATYIYEQRNEFISAFLPFLQDFYRQLSGGKEKISLKYESDLQKKTFMEWQAESFQQDLRMQRTLRGIHKDDWSFILNDIALKQFGSQGQKKSFLFALKLAQYTYISQKLKHLPILLLDDIFEKLDQNRMEALLQIIRGPGFGQVLLSDTHASRIQEAFGVDAEIEFIYL